MQTVWHGHGEHPSFYHDEKTAFNSKASTFLVRYLRLTTSELNTEAAKIEFTGTTWRIMRYQVTKVDQIPPNFTTGIAV